MYAQAPVNGAPAPAYPYGYPFAYQAPSQVVVPPSAGNTVHTGNNAPLIVQYITCGSGEEKLKSSKVDPEATGIYGQRFVAPAANESLTRDDIKAAVVDVCTSSKRRAHRR